MMGLQPLLGENWVGNESQNDRVIQKIIELSKFSNFRRPQILQFQASTGPHDPITAGKM